MLDILGVVVPVFLVLGFGYVAVWRGVFAIAGAEALMVFTQKFAIPCLLFRAIQQLDLRAHFDWGLLASFYAGAAAVFVLGIVGARTLFRRSPEDSVAIGFAALFANTVLLGLPITERAYGADALAPNYAIVALNAAFCYLLGITAMEVVKARGASLRRLVPTVAAAMFRNALMIGVALGFVANLTGLVLPVVLADALDLMIRAALPAALFALGGVLAAYRPEGNLAAVMMVAGLSLIVHPAITYGIGRAITDLGVGELRSAVVTAAMAPGVNAYVFASLYGHGKRIAATSVLVGTALAVVTASAWLWLLP